MGKVVFMFSGQGAQYTGMGRELYESSPAARAVFDGAERVRPGTIGQCFDGSAEELAITENTQPCIYCVDLAAAAALKESGVAADMLAGFSLGEVAALTFSGAVSCDEGFKLVCVRAKLMQQASETVSAGMAAVMKLSDEKVTALCNEFDNIHPVNFNCNGQVVVAGLKDQLDPFIQLVKDAGGRAMPLKVGGAFHSPFMAGAADAF
ncbi:MAG: ACP S-malonyltransferase, partial [Oscillospiraceae bacterium]|nr:ACP S-malonyltransferase [Oscillospiraceae bacterium]